MRAARVVIVLLASCGCPGTAERAPSTPVAEALFEPAPVSVAKEPVWRPLFGNALGDGPSPDHSRDWLLPLRDAGR